MTTINISASEQKPAAPVQEPATTQPQVKTDPPKPADKPEEQKK